MSPVPYLEIYYKYCLPQNSLLYPELIIFALNHDVDFLNKVSQTVSPASELCSSIKLDSLRQLITALKQYEHDFYSGVLGSNSPNFLITSYYSIYLRFLELLYPKLEALTLSVPVHNTDNVIKVVNTVIGFFGAPILQYITKKDVPPGISYLAGILLHALISSDKRASFPDNMQVDCFRA